MDKTQKVLELLPILAGLIDKVLAEETGEQIDFTLLVHMRSGKRSAMYSSLQPPATMRELKAVLKQYTVVKRLGHGQEH